MTVWIESRPDLRLAGTARDGREALEAVERLRPDLVIVEAILPGMDGFHLTRTLKARATPPLVVLVTFYATAAAREEAFASGADGFLAKYDFADGLEEVLLGWSTGRTGTTGGVTTPARRAPRESQNVPDP